MLIYTSRSGDLFFLTITTEVPDSSEGSTVTFRLSREDADGLSRQLAHEVTDWHIENAGEEHNDPHERAALMDEYNEQELEKVNVSLFANEPV